MKRSKNSLEGIDSLLPGVAKVMGIDSRMKELMLMNYWPEIVKGKIANDTRPYSVTRTQKGLVLNVGAKSSMVVQEINMVKMVVLDRLNSLASQIGLRVSDVYVSTKFWQADSVKTIDNESSPVIKKELSQGSLDSIELTEDQLKEVDLTLSTFDVDDEVLERLRGVLVRDLKLKNIKQREGYPVCENCGVILHNKNDTFCPACKF